MAWQTDKMRVPTTCAVDISPDVVDAGAELTLQGKLSCAPSRDLRGHTFLIKDHTGADARRVEFNEFDGVTNLTPEFVMKAPIKPGQYTWSAVSPAIVKEGISYAQASTPIS